METLNKHKHDLLVRLLSEGDAMVCLDARRPEVDVPDPHKTNPKLSLIINLNFKRPVEVTETGVTATLSFGGKPYSCVIPFTAVWAIYEPNTQKGHIWEECIPKDANLVEQLLKSPEKSQKTSAPKITKKPGWRKLPDETAPKRDRSHLRVIK